MVRRPCQLRSRVAGVRHGVAPENRHAAAAGMPALAPLAPWFALRGPAGLRVAEVARLNTGVRAAAATPAVVRRRQALGSDPVRGEDAAGFIAAGHARGRGGLRAANFRPE